MATVCEAAADEIIYGDVMLGAGPVVRCLRRGGDVALCTGLGMICLWRGGDVTLGAGPGVRCLSQAGAIGVRAEGDAGCQVTAPVRFYRGLEPFTLPDLEFEVW